jgi:hypothetical protein
LVARLAESGVHASFVLFAGEEHLSSAISALDRGISFALRPETTNPRLAHGASVAIVSAILH